MDFKKNIYKLSMIVVLSILSLELFLRFERGLPPPEPLEPMFKEQYEDIYKKFFEKVRLHDGSVVYKPKRKQEIAEESFAVRKAKGTKRIFVLGGSVAYSFSYNKHRQYMAELLENSIAGIKFEVIGCGMAAYDSYRVSLIFKEILEYEPDLIVLLSGNNEYFFPVHVIPWAYRLNRFFRNSWVYQEIQNNFFEWDRNHYNFFGVHELNRKIRLVEYEDNLKAMINLAQKRRIPVFLCTLPSNFRDCPPTGFPDWQDQQFLLAWIALNKNEFGEASKRFEQFLKSHTNDPFGHYFLGRCYDRLGDFTLAREHYLKALDWDTEPGDRCPPSRNQVIGRISSSENTILVDLEGAFIKLSPHGLLGDDFFVDNCHWWDEYCPFVYEEICHSIISYYRLKLKTPSVPIDKWRESLLSTRENFLSGMKEDLRNKAIRRLLQIPGELYNVIWYFPEEEQVCKINFRSERSIAFIKKAYRWYPELFDEILPLKNIIFKETLGNLWLPEKAVAEFDEMWPIFLYHAAEAFHQLGEYSKAMEYFNEAIKLKGRDIYLPYLGRALVYLEKGEFNKARSDLQKVPKYPCRHPPAEFFREILQLKE